MMADGCSICDVCLPPARPRSQHCSRFSHSLGGHTIHQHLTTDVDSQYVRTRAAEMDPKSTPQLTFS